MFGANFMIQMHAHGQLLDWMPQFSYWMFTSDIGVWWMPWATSLSEHTHVHHITCPPHYMSTTPHDHHTTCPPHHKSTTLQVHHTKTTACSSLIKPETYRAGHRFLFLCATTNTVLPDSQVKECQQFTLCMEIILGMFSLVDVEAELGGRSDLEMNSQGSREGRSGVFFPQHYWLSIVSR